MLLQWACRDEEMDVARKIAEKFFHTVEEEVRVFTILLIMCGRCFCVVHAVWSHFTSLCCSTWSS